ncbi:MAG: rRNA maturation RNase YbeY [Patescibacteria group bacterium]
MTSPDNFHIHIKTKSNPSPDRLLFASIKEAILGKDYDLAVILTTPKETQRLNRDYRQKDSPTDILSFPINSFEGEIYLDIETAKVEAPKFDRPIENFLPFLFIHGCLHLKGMAHGSTMEKIEAKFRKEFGI